MTLSAKNPMRVVLLSVLLFEIIVFALAIPVMVLVSEVAVTTSAVFAGGAALLALLAAGLLRRQVGYPLGWLTQLAGVLLGLLTPAMFVVGGVFLALWLITFLLGRRLEEQGHVGPG